MDRLFRYIESGHGKDSLTQHEVDELAQDFDMDVDGFYVLTPLTKEEWDLINNKEGGK